MLSADGLYGHIRANRWRSAFLLAAFVVLVALFWLGWCILYSAVIDHWLLAPKRRRYDATVLDVLGRGLHYAQLRWWLPVVGAVAWFTIAYLMHADMIRLATGARGVERRHAKALYNRVERLAIAAGLPMPSVQIIPTSALNAYAAGLTPDASVVAVTQGLLDTLAPDELDAVIAHEIAHIKHRDVQLMTVATCFAGGLTLVGSGIAKSWSSSSTSSASDYEPVGVLSSAGRAATRRNGPPVAAIAGVVIAVLCLALAHIFALIIKYALSRSREFLADAGAVELTKNPDALIRALRKISSNDQIEGLDPTVEAMMISATTEHLFSTHPPIEDRVGALVRHAGGRESASQPAPRRPARFLPEQPALIVGGATMPLAAPPQFGRRRRNFLDASRA